MGTADIWGTDAPPRLLLPPPSHCSLLSALLQLFHAHAGEALSRDRLLNEVWGYNYYGTTRTLDQVIVQLRKKLEDNKGAPKRLLTVHGVGYKLAV